MDNGIWYQKNILWTKEVHVQTAILTYIPLVGVTMKEQKPAGHI